MIDRVKRVRQRRYLNIFWYSQLVNGIFQINYFVMQFKIIFYMQLFIILYYNSNAAFCECKAEVCFKVIYGTYPWLKWKLRSYTSRAIEFGPYLSIYSFQTNAVAGSMELHSIYSHVTVKLAYRYKRLDSISVGSICAYSLACLIRPCA